MATITGIVRDHTTNKSFIETAITRIDFKDGELARSVAVGVIRSPGVLPHGTAGSAGSTLIRNAKGTASDIGGYRDLQSTAGVGFRSDRSAIAQTNQTILIEEYATDAGDLDGVNVTGVSALNWQVEARRAFSSIEDAVIEMRWYHRTAGGSETLLDTQETTNLTTSNATYNGTASITTSFATNERLVWKFFIHNKGVAPGP